MKLTKASRRAKIKLRSKGKVKGTAERPRISVYRSNKAIFCQLIDDVKGHTLAAVSVKSEGVSTSGTKSEQAKSVGKILAEKAIAQNITTAVFDRSGYIYHGRVKALADGAREGGLQF